MESNSASAGLEDPQRIEAARRLLAEARGEALDRLAALSARLLGAAHAQIALITDAPAVVTPTTDGQPGAGALVVSTFEHGGPLVLAHVQRDGVAAFLGVPIDVPGAGVGVLCVYDSAPPHGPRHDTETL